MRAETQYYFRTCLRIIAEEGSKNNPALISNTNKPAPLARPLPQEGDLASRSWAFLDRASHGLDGPEEGRVGRPEILHRRLQRAPRAPRPGPCPCLRRKARQLLFLCFLTPSGLPFSEDGAQSSAGGSQGRAWRGQCDQRRARPLYSENRKASLSLLPLGGQWGVAQLRADLQPSPRSEPFPQVGRTPSTGVSPAARAAACWEPTDKPPSLPRPGATSTTGTPSWLA